MYYTEKKYSHPWNAAIFLLVEQAYASFMKGSVSFELQNWKEALELFRQAKYAIYSLLLYLNGL